jgi:hypothetical protein
MAVFSLNRDETMFHIVKRRPHAVAAAVFAGVCASLAVGSAQGALTPGALQGMWKLTSISIAGANQPTSGYMVFMGDRYLFVTTRGERPAMDEGMGRKGTAELTDAEKRAYVEAFRTMTASAGPYSIVGGEIHYVREVVRSPNLTGLTEKRGSRLEGNKLIQDFIGGGQRQIMVWERVATSRAQ